MAIRELWRPPGEEQVVGMLLNFFRDIIELDKIYEQTGCYKALQDRVHEAGVSLVDESRRKVGLLCLFTSPVYFPRRKDFLFRHRGSEGVSQTLVIQSIT